MLVLSVVDASASADRAAAAAIIGRAAALSGLGQPQPVEIAGKTLPRAAALLAAAQQRLAELKFAEAVSQLDAAVAEVALTGASSLDAPELDDVFLLRGAAALRLGEATRSRAWEDFIRAATLAPARVLDAGRFAPAVVETWERAVAEARRRPHGSLVVRGPASARIFVDGRAAVGAPAVTSGLTFGEHYVRVEEAGRAPWATVVVLSSPTLDLDVPARALLTLDDRSAADRGRRAGARLVLLVAAAAAADASAGEALSDGDAVVELSLIRVTDASRRGGAQVGLGQGAEAVAAAMTRLVRAEAAPAAAELATLGPRADDRAPPPKGLDRKWWLLAGAIVVIAGVAVALAVAHGGGSATNGFSVTADPRGVSP